MRILKSLYKLFFPVLKYVLYPESKIESYLYRTVKVGKGVIIKSGCHIEKTTIGDYTFIGTNTSIDAVESIGRYCSIAKSAFIGLGSHPIDRLSTSPVFYDAARGFINATDYIDNKPQTIIENDVWIGTGVCIMKGVKIETGAIIGSGSIVTKDVPAYAIVVGNPAKVIRFRFEEEVIQKLLQSQWWEKDVETLLKESNKTNSHSAFINHICSRT